MTVAELREDDIRQGNELMNARKRLRESTLTIERLRRENAALREKLTELATKEVVAHADDPVSVGDSGGGCGRRPPVLVSEGRVPTDPMNSPLNPEVNPPPYAALR